MLCPSSFLSKSYLIPPFSPKVITSNLITLNTINIRMTLKGTISSTGQLCMSRRISNEHLLNVPNLMSQTELSRYPPKTSLFVPHLSKHQYHSPKHTGSRSWFFFFLTSHTESSRLYLYYILSLPTSHQSITTTLTRATPLSFAWTTGRASWSVHRF